MHRLFPYIPYLFNIIIYFYYTLISLSTLLAGNLNKLDIQLMQKVYAKYINYQ